MIKFNIDAGHGAMGITPGKRSPDGEFIEGDYNRRIARVFSELAKKSGHSVNLLIGNALCDVKLSTRVKADKFFDSTLLVSFHVNAIGNQWQTKASGMRVLYRSQKKLADHIASTIVGGATAKYRPWLYMLRRTKSPALIVEVGFMDNKRDLQRINFDMQLIANQLLNSIEEFYNEEI